MSELNKLSEMSQAQLEALPLAVYQTMRASLKVMAQYSTTKYMVRTRSPKGRGDFPLNTIPTNPTTLTQRTGELARALTRTDHPQNIQFIRQDGLNTSAELGLKSEYAHRYGIHETGGTIPVHQISITERMRKFFWAKWFESGKQDDKWKWMALKRSSDVMTIPAVNMPARPFLAPVTRDEGAREDILALFAKRIPEAMRDTLRLAMA